MRALLYNFILLLILIHCIGELQAAPAASPTTLQRQRRQIDFTASVDHNDKDKETELALEAIANLWKSKDERTQVEGSAKVVHRSNSLQTGNTSYNARIHVHHEYKKRP